MNQIKRIISGILIFVLVGFFANFAHNDYGLSIVKYGLLLVGIFQVFIIHNILKYGKNLFTVLILTFFSCAVAADITPESIQDFFLITQIFIIFALWFFPLFLLLFERKSSVKTHLINYIDAYFIFMLSTSFFYKIDSRFGASVLLVLSLPYLLYLICLVTVQFLKMIFKKSAFDNQNLLRLGLGLFCAGTVFKIQHWPFANNLILISNFVLPLSVIILFVDARRKKVSFLPQGFSLKILFITLSIMTFYQILARFSLNPPLYFNNLPIAMYEYEGILGDEKINMEKFYTYEEEYRDFRISMEKVENDTE